MATEKKEIQTPPLPVKVKQPLNELKMSWLGKLFFASAAAYIGLQAYKGATSANAPKLPIKIRGTKQQIKAIMDAITSSAAFQREINRPGATINSTIEKLNLKNLSKQQFEKLTGRPWPL